MPQENPEPTVYQKMAANLSHLRKEGASRERIQQEINYWKGEMDAKSKAERALSGWEKVAATGSHLAGGATFGLFDEASALWGDKDTQRYLQKQLKEENPALAFGAELTGALAVPVPFLKGAPKAAGKLAKVGRVLAEGAIQGALAGAGNAEGGLKERAKGAAYGGGFGAVGAGATAGVIRGVAKYGRGTAEAMGLAAPKLEEIAGRVPEADIVSARQHLSNLESRKLGHEAMVADVLPQGEGALRQAATSSRKVRKNVDQELRQRMNRLTNEADDRFSQYTGTQPQSARKSVEQLNEEASTRAKPLYEEAEGEMLAFEGLPKGMQKEVRAKLDEAVGLPYVQQRSDQLRKAPRSRFTNAEPDDHFLLDQVYKDIGREIRSLPREKWSLKEDLIMQRAVLADAMTARSPAYKKALSEFADPMARKEAYEMGSQRTPSDVIPSELRSLEPAEAVSYKEGKAQLLRRDVPNLDVGEFARFQDVLAPIATKEKAGVFRATFGDSAYKEYVKDLLEMAGLQRMRAGGGESTTADKLLEQLQSDPEAIVGMVAEVLKGNPLAAAAQFSPTRGIGKALDRLRNSREAEQNADFLMQRGSDKVKNALDYIERLRAAGKLPQARNFKKPSARNLVARELGAYGGRASQ